MTEEPLLQPGMTSKPNDINTLGIITLISGVVNVGLGLGMMTLSGITIIGLCCVPIFLLQVILGVFEIIYAVRLLSDPPKPTQPWKVVAILEICCILFFNVIALAVGIVALVLYNKPEVQEYFDQLNA
jgi:hypothetical protein